MTRSARGVILQRTAGVARSRVPTEHLIDPQARAQRNQHRGAVIWLTGLPGAGKSTIAMRLEERLFHEGYFAYVLDGDNLRSGLSRDLGFSPRDRHENVRRVAEAAALFADAGAIAIAALISPFRADRAAARAAAGDRFCEVYIKAEVATCERRDPKGLYAKARAGLLKDFTGVDARYEEPNDPEVVLDTDKLTIVEAVDAVHTYVADMCLIPQPARTASAP